MRFNLVAAVLLILIGLFMLASNLGWTHLNLSKLLLTWWPVALVGVGIAMLFGRGNKEGGALRRPPSCRAEPCSASQIACNLQVRGSVTPVWPWYLPPRSRYDVSQMSSAAAWKNSICATPSLA